LTLNFMKDVPSMAAVDFNALALDPLEWKVLARVDGRNNLEEIRLLAGLTRDQAEACIQRLFERGVITIRRTF
jgi:hypothetical protein